METTQKRQKAKVGVSGSFINQLMSNNSSLPEVGKGATQLHYSDRTPFEVVEVSPDGKTAKLEYLDHEWDKTKGGGHGHQNWILKPTGRFLTLIWRNKAWRCVCTRVIWDGEFWTNVLDGINHGSEKYKAILSECYDEDNHTLKVVSGKTRVQTTYPKINILFGHSEYYYDWSF